MARQRRILMTMLHLLNKKPLIFTEICLAVKKPKSLVAQNLAIARNERLVECDELKRYRVTLEGKSIIKYKRRWPKVARFQVDTQIPDYWGGSAQLGGPKAVCSLVSEDAIKIQNIDKQEPLYDTFYSKNGLGLPTNDTNLKRALASVVDTILDIRARDLGLKSVLDLQHRADLDVYNLETNFPSYDMPKRYFSLPNTKFTAIIEFDGTKWVKKQDVDTLEHSQQEESRSYRQEMMQGFRSKDKALRLAILVNSLIHHSIGEGISNRALTALEEDRFFATKEELMQNITRKLNFYLPDDKNRHKKILKNLTKSGLFKIQTKSYYCLRVDKGRYQEFLNSTDKT
jgi:hypothetical protein